MNRIKSGLPPVARVPAAPKARLRAFWVFGSKPRIARVKHAGSREHTVSPINIRRLLIRHLRKTSMSKLIDEIKYDLNFISTHSLQPQWYKVFKVILVLGIVTVFSFLFGIRKTILFITAFFILTFFVHMIFRVKTNRFTKSWLDFVVVEAGDETRAESIGKFYYLAILINAIISLLISHLIY